MAIEIVSQVKQATKVYVIRVTLTSIDVIPDPETYVSQPSIWMQILALAGLPQLLFIKATLVDEGYQGQERYYTLDTTFDETYVLATGHYHDSSTLTHPLQNAYEDGPSITVDGTLGPVDIRSSVDTIDYLQVRRLDGETHLKVDKDGILHVGNHVRFGQDCASDIGSTDGGLTLRRPRDFYLCRDAFIGRNVEADGYGLFGDTVSGKNFEFDPQVTNPDTEPLSRHIYWNSTHNEPYAWDGTSEYSLVGGAGADADGVIFIENLTPDTGNINCAFAENGTRVDSAVASPDVNVITVHVFAYTGHEQVRPAVTVNSVPVSWSTAPQKDPTAYEGTVDLSGFTLPLTIVAVHQDGNEYEVEVTADAAPQITTLQFTGGYPGSQTELKAGDNFDINIQTDIDFVEVEVEDSGACSAQSFPVGSTSNHTFTSTIANRGTTTQALPARVRVRKSTGTWSDWVYTNDGGGTIDGQDLVNLNNLYPTVTPMNQTSITYPAGQEAIKDSETVTVTSVCADFDTISYTSLTGELSIPNSSTYAANKSGVQRVSGGYNISSANYTITANRAANNATTTESTVVYIAHDAAQIVMTEPASRLRTGGNDSTSPQDHVITLTANQRLITAPTIANPPAGGGTWQGTGFSGGPEVWTRDLQCHDNDTVGTYSYGSLVATNLANRITTSYTGDSSYTIGGFVSRTITLAAFANEATFNAAVADYSKCTLVWEFKSLPNRRPFNTTTTPDPNSWCFAGTIGSLPTIARILDTAATGSSSNNTDVTVEETV